MFERSKRKYNAPEVKFFDQASGKEGTIKFTIVAELEEMLDCKERNEQIDMYNKIKKYATEKNEAEIQKIIDSGVCVDYKIEGFLSPCAMLASENHTEAARFLIEKFNASIHFAVIGAAAYDYHDLYEELLRKGANIDLAAEGCYLCADTFGRESKLREMGASLDALAKSHIRGFGKAGSFGLSGADEYIKLGANKNAVVEAAGWYATETEYMEQLISQGASKDYAVRGAAAKGYFIKNIEDLLKRGASRDFAVFGAASGGHTSLVQDLLNNGASAFSAIEGAITGAHFPLAEKLVESYPNLAVDAINIAKRTESFRLNIPGNLTQEEQMQKIKERSPSFVRLLDLQEQLKLKASDGVEQAEMHKRLCLRR